MTKKYNVTDFRKMIEIREGDAQSSRKTNHQGKLQIVCFCFIAVKAIILEKMLFDVTTSASKCNSINRKDGKWRDNNLHKDH